MDQSWRMPAWLAVVFALAGAGCANPIFYNDARDKQGQALGKAVSQVDLVAVVSELDGKFIALRQLEADTLKARQATNRNLEIALVASAGAEGTETLSARYVRPLLDRRLERLLGAVPDAAEMDRVRAGLAEDGEVDRQAQSKLRAFNAMSGLNIDSCAAADRIATSNGDIQAQALAGVSAGKQVPSKLLFKDAHAKCKATRTIFTAPTETSLLRTLIDQRDRDEMVVEQYRKALQTQQERLASALRDYEIEAKALQPKADDAGFRAQLTAAADRLKDRIDALRSAAQPGQLGAAFAQAEAIERLDALSNVLGALASGASDPAQLSASQLQAVALVRLIPSVADDANKLLQDAKRPRLGPLLLAKEQQRLAVEGFAAQLALLERKAAIRQKQVDAARDEVFALARARRALGPPAVGKGATVDLGKTIDEALVDPEQGGRRRVALYESFALYFDHAQTHRVQQEMLDLEANGITDEIVIAQSRSAAKMWQSLMSNMASILADYHSAGIKPADLAEFVKGIGLFYIGYGAGK